MAVGKPGISHAAAVAQHPLINIQYKSQLFSHRDKFGGIHQSPLRVLPAHQRFNPRNSLGFYINLRLEIQTKFIIAYGATQLPLEAKPESRGDTFVGREKAVAVATTTLGIVHGDISILNQGFHIFPGFGKHGDANATTNMDFMSFDIKRLLQRVDKLSRNLLNTLYLSHFREQQNEFVTAKTRQRVAAAHTTQQALRHRLQQAIAQ